MPSDIKIRFLTGAAIRTYIPSIAKVRSEVLKEFPYLRAGNVEEDTRYLQRCSQSKDAIAVLVFDGPKVVGVSTGVPLEEERAFIQKPFIMRGEDISDYYYFGLCALLPPYRGRGIAHHFFDIREEHVQHLKRFRKICLTDPLRPKNHDHQPKDYISLDAFWKKRGYVKHQELICQFAWHEQDGKEPVPVSLVYWIKEIEPTPALASVSAEVEKFSDTLTDLQDLESGA